MSPPRFCAGQDDQLRGGQVVPGGARILDVDERFPPKQPPHRPVVVRTPGPAHLCIVRRRHTVSRHRPETVAIIDNQTGMGGATKHTRLFQNSFEYRREIAGEELMTCSTSAVAACWASASSRSANASSRSALYSASCRCRAAIRLSFESANLLSGMALICGPRRDRLSERMIPWIHTGHTGCRSRRPV